MEQEQRATETEIQRARAMRYVVMADAVVAKLSDAAKARIADERRVAALDAARFEDDVRRWLGDFPSLVDASIADDHIRFACLLAAVEMALALASFLARSDAPSEVRIDDREVVYAREGETRRVPRTYFISRIAGYAQVSPESAVALCDAIVGALCDGTLSYELMRCHGSSDGTVRIQRLS